MRLSALQSDILRFILQHGYTPGDQMPTIREISEELGVSVAKTREALEIARALGAVEIKPGRGTSVSEYSFAPAVTLSALYAIGLDPANFRHLRRLRDAIEIRFWDEAVKCLMPEDIIQLRRLIKRAYSRLERQPIQVPAEEHRAFHMTIFSRLNNPFVIGVLIAFWEAYEAFGLNLYQDLSYHHTVWDYHRRIVDAIEAGDSAAGRLLLEEHMNLLVTREQPASSPERLPESNDHSPFFE